MLTSRTGSNIRLEHHEPSLPRAESVRAYLVKARAQARALVIIIIIIQVYRPYGI
jgi:hypothetical protein